MSEWKECKLGDIIKTANTGLDAIKRAPIVEHDTGIKCLRIQDISQKKDFKDWGFCEVEKNNYNRFEIKKGDIYVARTGATIGVNLLIKKNVNSVFNNGLIRLRVNEDIADYEYVYHSLCSYEYKGHIENISGGTSTQPNMQINALLDYEMLLPPLPEQKAIATVLSSLDDKIDLLHRQNKTLEAMAESLFRQWFVEEASDDWEEGKLGDITSVSIGRTPPRQEFHWFSENKNDVKWISIKDLATSGVFVFDTAEKLTREAVKNFNIPIIPKDTVILSFKMTVGRVGITTEEMLSNEAIAHFIKNSNTPFTKEYLYFFLKTFNYDALGSTSSIVTAINSSIIKELIIKIPPNQIMDKFKETVENQFIQIKANQMQINILEKLRDTLLPKLMSGEVKVS